MRTTLLERDALREWAVESPARDTQANAVRRRRVLDLCDDLDDAIARANALEKELTATSWGGRDAHAAQLERENALRADELEALRDAAAGVLRVFDYDTFIGADLDVAIANLRSALAALAKEGT